MTQRKTALLCGSTLGLVIGLGLVSPAMAQSTSTTTAGIEDKSTEVGEIVIVGSRIRRDTYNTPAPVQLITREEATLAGFNSPTDLLLSNQVTGGQRQIDNTFGGFVTDGGPGANTIGLRGLSAQRTLILLNGRRVAPVGTRGAVGSADTNVLPSALIDRVEILKDGASSIYGSDAIAGVINIITKKHVDGVTLETQYNAPFAHGGESFRTSLSGGWTHDKLEVAGSFDYYNRSNLKLNDRSYARCNDDYRFVDPTTRDDLSPVTGLPVCYPITGTGANGVTINTIQTPSVLGVAGPGTPRSAGLQTGTYNRFRPNSAVTTGVPGFEGVNGPGAFACYENYCRDTFDPKMLNESLISPAETYVLYGQFKYALTDIAELYGEVLASRRDSSQVGYRQLALDYAYFPGQAAGNSGRLGGALNTNPLLPTNLQFTTYAGVRQDPDITHGLPIGIRAFIGFGNDRSEQRADADKFTVGLRGDFKPLANWRYDVTGSYQGSNADYTFGSFIQSHLNQSLDVVPLPVGSSAPSVLGTNGVLQTCRVNTTGSNGCIPAPVLSSAVVAGNLPQNFRDWIFKPVTGNTKYDEAVLTANFDGPLAKLPAGDLQAAVGVEYRHDKLNDQPPPESVARDLFNFTSAVPSVGTDSVWEVYGEAEAPLLKDLPFAHSLTVNVSGRYTKYKEYSGQSTYKVGAKYEPFSWLTFRGTYGTSYRAPAVFESHQGATSGFQSATLDVCSNYGLKSPTSNLYKNCDADLHNINYVSTTGITVNTIGGSSLTPETSTNYGFGFIAQPKLGDRFGQIQFAVDYYNIVVEDEISQYSFSTYLSNCYNSAQFRTVSGFCDSVVRNSAGQLTVNSGYVNIAKQVVRGIDYNARYLHDLGPGSMRLNLLVTRYLEQSSKSTPTAPLLDENGTIFQPKYTATFDATYSWSDWKVRYSVDWTRKMNSYDDIFGPGADFANTGYVFKTPDYYVHNLSMEYQLKKNVDIVVGVRDLFDSKLPSISSEVYNRIGTVPLYSGYNFLGRTAFVNVSKKF